MKEKGWLIAALVSLGLLFVVKIDFFTSNVLKFFVNNFATGKSDFKVVFFLIYFTIAAFVLFFYEQGWLNRFHLQKIKKAPLLLFGLLLFLFIVGVGSHVFFVEKYGLDYTTYYKAVYQGKQSSTEFTHIHSSKAILSKLGDFFNPNSHYIYDEGLFYAHYLPSFFWIVFLVFLPIIFVLTLVVLVQFYQRMTEWKEYGLCFIFLFIIASMSSLKNSVDGSLFNVEALFWFPLFCVLLFGLYFSWRSDLRLWVSKGVGVPFLVFVFMTPLFVLFWDGFMFLWMRYVAFVWFVLFLFLILYTMKQTFFGFSVVVLLSFILGVFLIAGVYGGTYLNYSLDAFRAFDIEVPKGAEGYLYVPGYNASSELCEEYVYRLDDMAICRFSTIQNISMRELLNKYSVLPVNYYPITIQNVTCRFEHSVYGIGMIILVEGTVPASISTPLFKVTFQSIGVTSTGFERYSFEVNSSGCIPMFQDSDVLFRTFRQQGIAGFIEV